MKLHLVFVPALALLAGGAIAQPIADSDGVRQLLAASGHADVRDIERDGALWEAEVRGSDGRWYDLHVVADTGLVLDAGVESALLSAEEVTALLEAAGYGNVRDLDLDGAVWELDATATDGRDVELRVAATDGAVLESEWED